MTRKTILIMAGGTGGHIFGSDTTRASPALVSTQNVPVEEIGHD